MELSVLEDKNFSSYMLIVSDYINWAKDRMPVGPARGCFVPGSMVQLADGSMKAVEKIRVGEEVVSHDDSVNKVTDTLSYKVDEELVELEFENGKTITCTKDHEFFTTNRGWVKAGELTGDDDVKEV